MKQPLLTIGGILCSLFTFGQTFNSSTTANITDNNYCFVPITVTGLPAVADTAYGLCSVCVNITHTYTGDLDLYLISPTGDSMRLVNNQGGGGDNFTNTCFIMSATVQINNPNMAIPPFTGNYLPEVSVNNFNQGQNPNGVWRFGVQDEAPGDIGTINSVSLSFCANPPVDPPVMFGPCSINNGGGCYCPDSTQNCWLLPDMTASGDIIANQHVEYPGRIELSNATPNIGWGPMEIRGSGNCWCDTVPVSCTTTVCPNGDAPTQQLLQRLYRKNGNQITYVDTLTPGRMSLHPTHGHIHVNNWSEFTLRTQDPNEPNATLWPIVGRGSKVSFCLINLGDCTNNYGYCRDTLNNPITMNDIPNAPFGHVSGCGTEQGIYTGMLDIYSIGLPDMYIDLADVCNGNYYIVSITDPDNNFFETNDNNNWTAVPVTLTMQSTAITSGFNMSQSGSTVIFSNNNTDLISYVWDFGDGNIDSTSNPVTHTYSTPGTYTVTLTQVNGCGTYTSTQVITITGIGETENFNEQLLQVFPNPATDVVTLQGIKPDNGAMVIELFSSTGQLVYSRTENNSGIGAYSISLNLASTGISEGAYILKVSTTEHYAVRKLIIQQQ